VIQRVTRRSQDEAVEQVSSNRSNHVLVPVASSWGRREVNLNAPAENLSR
jgi:hypothetical protein